MTSPLLLRAIALLTEALDLLDRSEAPSDLGARLNDLIDRLQDLKL